MPHKYHALLRRRQQRLRTSLQHLAGERQRLASIEDHCLQLQGQLQLQEQLAGAGDLEGMSLDRQKLFGWLRSSAVDRRRSQALRLELGQQQESRQQCQQQVDTQQVLCRKQEQQLERYREFMKERSRKQHLRQLETEECEVEERWSWPR
ncbi:hypothetical protein [Herbaspirillum sp. SJZ099]|uniref:hypothetical protein n=1 Tax=Herbaspirillum sp. SJZ099 TaxID=2572916 RepID=UPI00119FD6D4|nr:hypothetical protein [Herbaspirillum sp. SJZ099]TWC66611.1 hypothetical protein FB597_105197 [Herbaspirillum sp. SJZ099]